MEVLLVLLVSCQAGGAGRNAAGCHQELERAVRFHLEDVEGTVAVGQAVKEPAIVALGHVNRVAAGAGYARSAIGIEQSEGAVMSDAEAGD